ncbi:hypothetical protein E4U21_004064 [Claviceps maximensis]|nr:hypothetical protein E4U21_004064 [Claviceps maximensis]
MPFTASDICKIILAIILPPVGVFLETGCGSHLLINILLTILGKLALCSPFDLVETCATHTFWWRAADAPILFNVTTTFSYIPGIIHALYVILKY